MLDTRIENINIYSEDSLMTPDELKALYPHSERAVATVQKAQQVIKDILLGKDPRLFVVVGPCSIHDIESAHTYAKKLKDLAKELDDSLFIVMRVYFEKPRTTVGWQGLINDPHLDGSCQIEDGLKIARKLLIDLAEMELPVAGEALDLITPQYVQDLISWTAIGARTTEAQTHRKMASGLSSAVGFKNGTDGSLTVAINAMHAAAHPNNFLSVDPLGKVAVIRTKGNSNTHVVLRGGSQGPNYEAGSIQSCEHDLENAGLKSNIMVDASHANSRKDPANQIEVLNDVTDQIIAGNQSIMGVMVESHLKWGNQAIPEDLTDLQPGVSITDACIDWETTEKSLRQLREKLNTVLRQRRQSQ